MRAVTPSLGGGPFRDTPEGSERTGPRRRGGGARRSGGGGRRVATPPARPRVAGSLRVRADPSLVPHGRAHAPPRAGARRRPGLSDPAAGLPERREAGGRASAAAGARPRSRSGTQQREPPGKGDARCRRRRPGVAERRGIPSHPGAGARSGRGGRSGSRSSHDGQGRAALP